MRTSLLITGLLLLVTTGAGATIWHVLPDGSGDAPTIAAAIQLAAPGDTVEVGCGTYHEHDIALASSITVRGATGNPACVEIVADGGSGFICHEQTGVVLEGLTVRDGFANYGAGIFCYVSSLTVRDCVFRDGYATGDGGITCSGSTLTLEGCRFEGNASFNEGAGAVWVRNSTAVIDRCVFADNQADGNGGALWLEDSDVTVTGSTFVGNRAASGSAMVAWSDEDASYRFDGCTMVGHEGPNAIVSDGQSLQMARTLVAFNEGQAMHVFTDLAPTMSCCDLFGNTGGDWTGIIAPLLGQDGNIAADPVLCDLAARDLHLEPDSPCAPQANPDCGLIGAWPTGCAITGVAPAVAATGPAVLHPAAPNPCNPRTVLSFDLARTATIRLEVTDLAGRRVALLRSGTLAVGRHEVVWSGRDEAGRGVPSGLYLCRLVGDGFTRVQRLALIR